MANLILPRRFSTQPQAAGYVDFANPLTQGIACARVWSVAGEGTIYDFADYAARDTSASTIRSTGPRNFALTKLGSPTRVYDPVAGVGRRFTASNLDGYYHNAGSGLADFAITMPITTLVVATPGSTVSGIQRSVYGTSSAADRWTGIAVNATANTWIYECYGGASKATVAGAGIFGDTDRCVVIGYSSSATSHALYVNGRADGTASTDSGTTTATQYELFGTRWNSGALGSYHNGDVFLAIRWIGHYFSLGEIQALSDNPWQIFKAPPRKYWISAASSPDITLGITGNAATGAVGTVGVAFDIAITGNAATSAVGDVAPVTAITGNSATGAVGTVGVAFDLAITGNSTTGAVGTVGVAFDIAVTSNAATSAVGTIGVAFDLAIIGNSVTGAVGTVGVAFDLAITGNPATGAVGTVIASQGGDVTLGVTGNVATGAAGNVVTTSLISINIGGNAATGAVGATGATLGLNISGLEGTTAVGSTSYALACLLAGSSVSAVLGSIIASSALGLSGDSGTGTAGDLGSGQGLSGNGSAGAAGSAAVIAAVLLAKVSGTGMAGNVTAINPNVILPRNRNEIFILQQDEEIQIVSSRK